jgi:hypothetical protein
MLLYAGSRSIVQLVMLYHVLLYDGSGRRPPAQ